MKKKGSYIKSALALALVVMMALSMMSGVLTLSANADEDDYPEVISEPIARCFDRYFFSEQYIIDRGLSQYDPGYQSIMTQPRSEIDVVLRLDNSKTKGTAHDLAKDSNGKYSYTCYLVYNDVIISNLTAELTSEYAEDFDLLILTLDRYKYSEYLSSDIFPGMVQVL